MRCASQMSEQSHVQAKTERGDRVDLRGQSTKETLRSIKHGLPA